MRHLLNSNRYICLFISIFIGILTWYNLILFTSKDFLPAPNSDQYKGLLIAITMGILFWFRQIYIIKL
jgi:hypothetical protein